MKHKGLLLLMLLALIACGTSPRPSIGIKDFKGVQVDIIAQVSPGQTFIVGEDEFAISYDYEKRSAAYLPLTPGTKVERGETIIIYRYKGEPPVNFIMNNINPTLRDENWTLGGGASICLPGECG